MGKSNGYRVFHPTPSETFFFSKTNWTFTQLLPGSQICSKKIQMAKNTQRMFLVTTHLSRKLKASVSQKRGENSYMVIN